MHRISRFTNPLNKLILLVIVFSVYLGFTSINKHYQAVPQITSAPRNSIYLYETTSPLFSAKIGSKDSTSPYVVFNNKNLSSISFSLKDSNSTSIQNNTNKIIFKEAQKDTDVIYTSLENGIKEEIIIQKATTSAQYIFNLTTSGAHPRKIGTNSYSPFFFDDKNNYQFHFEAPFAVDANGVRTDDLAFNIRQSKENKNSYQIQLIIPEKWITDKSRKFPIIVDPTVVHDTTSEFATGIFNRVKDTGSGSVPSLETYFQELPSNSGTVGLWHFNEASGNTLDSSGNSNTGTPTGTTVVTGFFGNARSFNGTSDTITITAAAGSSLDMDVAPITIEAWIKLNSITGVVQEIFTRGTSGVSGYGLLVTATGLLNLGSHGGSNFSGNTILSTGVWHHVAGVTNGTDSKIYLDGKLDGSGSLTINANDLDAHIGSAWDGAATTLFFGGIIDEVRVSNVARTAEEIRLSAQRRPYSVYTSDVIDFGTKISAWNSFSWNEVGVSTGDGETLASATNLVAQWNFNNTSGTTSTNNAGSCSTTCNGTLTSFASTGSQDAAALSGWTSDNKLWGAGALMFDGTDDHITVANTAALNPTVITLEAWYKTNTLSNYQNIIDKRNVADTEVNYLLQILPTTGLIQFSSRPSKFDLVSNSPIELGKWTYIAATFDGTTAKLYINGILSNSVAYSGSLSTSSDNSLKFCRHGSSSLYYCSGLLDSVRLYSRAISAAEVMSNYNAGNIELQTRVGGTSTPDDGTWEEWRPITNETSIDNFNNPLDYATPSASIFTGALIATSASTFPVIEGTKSLQITTGRTTSLNNKVGMWHLDETSGTGAYIKDSTSNANHGTPTGTYTSIGISGKGRVFNGTSDFIDMGDSTAFDFGSGNFTIEAWVKRNSFTTEDFIVGKDIQTAGNRQLGFKITAADTVRIIYFVATDTTVYLDTTATILDSEWHYLVGQRIGSSFNIYIDGVLSASGTTAGTHGTMQSTTAKLQIGRREYSTFEEYFDGSIDEVVISNTAISAEEINERYLLGTGHFINKTISSTDLSSKNTLPFYIAADRPGTFLSTTVGESGFANAQDDTNIRGLWHLEEVSGTGTYIKDVGTLGNHLSVNGTTIAQGVIGSARNFNGSTTDYLTCTDANCGGTTKLDPSNTSRSIGAWIKTSKVPQQFIMSKGQATGQYAYNLQLFNGGSPRFVMLNTADGAYIEASASAKYNDNNWHYIVGTYDGTTASIYVDGILNASSTTKTGTQVTNSTGSFQIGAKSDCTTCHWLGLIDEPFVIATSLSAERVRQSYEISQRTHQITIDFFSAISHTGPLSNSSDLTFTLMATPSGTTNAGDNIYKGDKIIVKENYNGTEYIAQGTVDSVNVSTGATTVSSWDASSTFPSIGFTPNASVFKWQREYWNISRPLSSHVSAITNFTLSLTNGNEGRTIWIDDLRSNSDYLTTPSGSSITSSTGNRYMQYRAINSSFDTAVSATLSAVTVDYTLNSVPGTPTLDSPTNTFVGTPLLAVLKTTATDTNSDYLRYKIELCTNVGMTTGCQTFDQTSSQTGWSGQNTQTSTAYTSGTQATYTLQSPLSTGVTYYWRSYAIDPNGVNSFGATQGTPYSFTTNSVPTTPTLDQPTDAATGVTTTTVFKTTTTDSESDYLRYKIQVCTNVGMTIGCQTFDQTSSQTGWSGQNTQTSTAYTSGTQATYTVQTPLSPDTTYYWRSYAIDPGGMNSFSGTQTVRSFTTFLRPPQPSTCTVTKNTANTQIIINWTDNSTSEAGYQVWKITDGGVAAQLGSNLAANTITLTDTSVTSGHSYGYMVRNYQLDGAVTYYSNFCVTASSNLNTGFFKFEGIKFN